MNARLWEKGTPVNQHVHEFTVGNDPEVDQTLAYWDCLASAAHARMLTAVGLLNPAELKTLIVGLRDLADDALADEFSIPLELEDCHTAIEDYLVGKYGDVGKKIHTGRSRNDQVLTAMRLYLRDETVTVVNRGLQLINTCLTRAEETWDIPMPGYTHLQQAMPSAVGLWFHAFGEHGLELIRAAFAQLDLANCNPLGSASGFGVPLPLNRGLTAELMAFDRVQRNPINTQNSRGRYELNFLRLAADFGLLLEKLAWDILLYSTREFGFFTVPVDFTTGSSIMPQKKNPDIAELLRARVARIRGAEDELRWVISKLPSNYHRDFQYTKEPVFRGAQDLTDCLEVAGLLVEKLTVNRVNLERAMSPELFATYDAYRRVREGTPFRDAYRQSAEQAGHLSAPEFKQDFSDVLKKSEKELRAARDEFEVLSGLAREWRNRLDLTYAALLEVPA